MKGMRMFSLRQILLLGLIMAGGAANSAHAQETVRGKFTVAFETRWGKAVLPAGSYTYFIEPIGIMQSLGSIQSGTHPVLVVVRSEKKDGHFASVIAMATPQASGKNLDGFVFEPGVEGEIVRCLYLRKLELEFDFKPPKTENMMLARGPEPPPSASGSKATD